MTHKHPMDTTHPAYDEMLSDWVMMSDIRKGQSQLKRRDLSKFGTYLTWLDAGNESAMNKQRNRQYIKMATFQNVTARTAQGMIGEIMRTQPSIEMPPTMMYMIDDIDGTGLSIDQHIRDSVDESLYKGGVGLLTDFPALEYGATQSEVEEKGIRPIVTMYTNENILNWDSRRVGAVSKLSYVLLSEGERKRRVLLLDEGNLYAQEVWAKDKERDWELVERFEPRNGSGARLNYIPFIRAGSLNNTIDIDTIPLIDIAHVNIGQYRNNADSELNSYASSHMQTWITGLTADFVKDNWGGKLELGALNPVVPLPMGSEVITTQARETSTSTKLAESKRREMIELGAKLIEPQAGNKTATQAELDASSETSILSMVAQNIQDAYQKSLEWAASFANQAAESVSIKMSTKFSFSKMTAQERNQLIIDWQSGVISKSVIRAQYRADGIIPSDITDEEIDEELSNDAGI